MHAVAYAGSGGESPFHQTVLVYDGPPKSGKLIAVTALRGATAASGHRVGFTWRPDELGMHTLHVRLLGHVAAGEDDLLTIPVLVEQPSANSAPLARDDAYSTRENRTLRVRAPGVLRNDRDAEGATLTAVRVAEPAHGSLRLDRDGSFTYRPARRFAGIDRFTYRASDGPLASDPVRVTIRVRPLPSCQGRRATIVGTSRRDVLRGTARADVIVAFGGNDTIRARRGRDRVCAGSGRDEVVSGAGRDHILGGVGRDRLLGGPHNDTLAGGPGNDTLVGGAGRNRLFGGLGNDTLVGRPGRDLISGGPGRNRILSNLSDAGKRKPIGRQTVSRQSRGRRP